MFRQGLRLMARGRQGGPPSPDPASSAAEPATAATRPQKPRPRTGTPRTAGHPRFPRKNWSTRAVCRRPPAPFPRRKPRHGRSRSATHRPERPSAEPRQRAAAGSCRRRRPVGTGPQPATVPPGLRPDRTPPLRAAGSGRPNAASMARNPGWLRRPRPGAPIRPARTRGCRWCRRNRSCSSWLRRCACRARHWHSNPGRTRDPG
jgi:hypothetical protein